MTSVLRGGRGGITFSSVELTLVVDDEWGRLRDLASSMYERRAGFSAMVGI
jgi:hypothetical protein